LRIDYPRRGRSGVRRFLPSWRQLLALAALGVVALGATFAVLYSVIAVPKPNDQALAQSTIVYYSDKTELGRFGAANRTIVSFDQIPLTLRQAVMSAEDRQFYEHGGFSVTGIARAAWNDLAGGSVQGGSTITQQLVKNYYLTQSRTISRKVNEFIVSIKIEQQLTKDQILTDYLNTIYFGRGAYGVQAAAASYFGVPASALTPSQAAVLASIIRSPGGYSPEYHLAKLKARWAFVLDGEVKEGWLTAAQRASAVFPPIRARASASATGGPAGYLTAYVQAELAARGYSDDDINTAGLRVYTTFDRKAEAAAVAAVAAERPKKDATGVRVGLASVNPANGGIVAMYGGPDYGHPQYINDATQSIAQAGSTFKAFTLVAALENGISLDSVWNGRSGQTYTDVNGSKTKPIPNEDGKSYGQITLLQATEDSVNTVFVNVENQPEVGAAKVVDAARRAGVPDNVVIDPVLSATLGVASPTALDMASAYGTFASGGFQTSPTAIARIVGSNGGLLYDLSQSVKRNQTIDPSIVSQVDYALQKVVTDGTGTKARAVGRPVAGKTGTTDSNLSAWFVGYTPQLSTAVVMFRTEPDGKTRASMNGVGGIKRVNGGSFPASIWTSYMTKAVKGMPVEQFPTPLVTVPTTSPSPTVSATPTPSSTPSPTSSPTASPSPTPSSTPSPSSTPTPTPTASASPTGGAGAPASPGAPVAPAAVLLGSTGILAAGERRLHAG
jgi:membrane peptidoglycan carboxypeptidase